jgi:hypothetical protein
LATALSFKILSNLLLTIIHLIYTILVVSRESLVGIATGYGLDEQGEREFESR